MDLRESVSATTPSEVVQFDKLTPTTSGVVFDPNTPATSDVLYVSTVNASTWIYNGSSYITYTAATLPNTPFYLANTTIDAGGNKTAFIEHLGPIRATSLIGSGLNITTINASNLSTGIVNVGRLGTGAVGSGDKYLADNNTWKTIVTTPRVQVVTSAATVTPISTNDLIKITAQAAALTLANPTGTFVEGQDFLIRIKDDGTARAITFDTKYRAIGVTLPTTTTISKTMYLGVIYNATDDKFDVVATPTQA